MELSHLPRADLVRELLTPHIDPATPAISRAGDSESGYAPVQDEDAVLTRKLGVARELLMRDLHARLCSGPILASPGVVRDWLRLHCAHLEHEVFMVLYLTVQNHLIEAEELFRGTLTQTSVYPRELVMGALRRNAAAVVIAHNHPSGSTQPSRADEHLTQTLRSALALVDVKVLDHMIVAGAEVVSFGGPGVI